MKQEDVEQESRRDRLMRYAVRAFSILGPLMVCLVVSYAMHSRWYGGTSDARQPAAWLAYGEALGITVLASLFIFLICKFFMKK